MPAIKQAKIELWKVNRAEKNDSQFLPEFNSFNCANGFLNECDKYEGALPAVEHEPD